MCSNLLIKKWGRFEYPTVSDYYNNVEGLEEHYYMTLENKKRIFLEKINKRGVAKIPCKNQHHFYLVTKYAGDNTKWQVSLFIDEQGDLKPLQNYICDNLINGFNDVFTCIDMKIDWEEWVKE